MDEKEVIHYVRAGDSVTFCGIMLDWTNSYLMRTIYPNLVSCPECKEAVTGVIRSTAKNLKQ